MSVETRLGGWDTGWLELGNPGTIYIVMTDSRIYILDYCLVNLVRMIWQQGEYQPGWTIYMNLRINKESFSQWTIPKEYFSLTHLVLYYQPLQHPLSMFVQHMRTQECETLHNKILGRFLLFLQLQKHSELHHLRLQLAERWQTLCHTSFQTCQGGVLRLCLGDDEWPRVNWRWWS